MAAPSEWCAFLLKHQILAVGIGEYMTNQFKFQASLAKYQTKMMPLVSKNCRPRKSDYSHSRTSRLWSPKFVDRAKAITATLVLVFFRLHCLYFNKNPESFVLHKIQQRSTTFGIVCVAGLSSYR